MIIIAVLLLLGIVPFFLLLGSTVEDLCETQRQIRKNEEDLHKMIYGNKGV